jgi:hypothetical protein
MCIILPKGSRAKTQGKDTLSEGYIVDLFSHCAIISLVLAVTATQLYSPKPLQRRLMLIMLLVQGLLHISAHCSTILMEDTSVLQQVRKTNLTVDLSPALVVARSGADGTEEDVHLLEGDTLGLGEEEEDEGGAHGGEDTEEDVGTVA